MSPLRVVVFEARPDTVLIHVPEGGSLCAPSIPSPFTKEIVARAFADAGIEARVSESVPGRWTSAIHKIHKDAKAERRQRDAQRIATSAAIMRGSSSEMLKERGEALARKLEVDAEIRDVSVRIKSAKSEFATRGVRMEVTAFRRLEKRQEVLKQESQAIQSRLGELRKQEKELNRNERESEAIRFMECARQILDPEDFDDILSASIGEDEDDEEQEQRAS